MNWRMFFKDLTFTLTLTVAGTAVLGGLLGLLFAGSETGINGLAWGAALGVVAGIVNLASMGPGNQNAAYVRHNSWTGDRRGRW